MIMHAFLKRVISYVLVICFAVSPILPHASAAYNHPSDVWKYTGKCDEAVANNDCNTISSLADTMMSLYNGEENNIDNCSMRRNLCAHAARAYEKTGSLEKSVEWYQMEQGYNKWLNSNGEDYENRIISVDSMIKQLDVSVEIFAEASNPADVPYYGALGERRVGVLHGSNADGSISGNESAQLIYVEFDPECKTHAPEYNMEYWIGKCARDQNQTVRDIFESGGVLEIAWNFPEEASQLADIVSGKYNDYVNESLTYLASLNEKDITILLRIGAEMNCWDNAADADEFKAAFQLIAGKAHEADNIATVFSPNDVSTWKITYLDYYPGDAFVDWIGVSTYYRALTDTSSYMNDAYYYRGVYSNNPLTAIKELAATFPNKPMMISECGFSYYNNFTGENTEDLAIDRLQKFYTYLPMVYPQVKAMFYFDQTISEYGYKFENNSNVANAYKAITSEAPFLSSPTDDSTNKGYTRLATLNEKTEYLKLYTYAIFPNGETTNCVYKLDGNTVSTVSGSVLAATVKVSELTKGWHTLTVDVSSGNISRTVARKFFVSAEGVVTGSTDTAPENFSDVHIGQWYYGYIQYASDHGLFYGMTKDTFAPEGTMTRAQFVTVLSRFAGLMGENTGGYSSGFKDVKSDAWYASDVGWAASKGIVTGYSSESFGPDDNMTREQMITLLVRFSDHKGLVLDGGNSASFIDGAKVSDWAQASMTRGISAGFISGYEDNTIRPQGNITRAEAATVCQRFASKYGY